MPAYVTPGDVRDTLAGIGSLTGTAAALSDPDLTDAIAEAQDEVDGRLARRYATPFENPPAIVVNLTRDIAAYLATLTYRRGEPIAANEPVQLRYNRAQTLLAQAATGALPLLAPDGTAGEDEAEAGDAAVANRFDGDLFAASDFGLGTVPSGWGGSLPTWPSGRW